MLIYIGSDHRGFQLKESLKNFLRNSGYKVIDLGNAQFQDGDDYPDFAAPVAKKISLDPSARGIVICGSGAGVDIVANRHPNVRSVLAINPDQVAVTRSDDDTNVLSLAADYTDEEAARKIVSIWLQTPFSGEERHQRRLKKIEKIG